MQTPKKVIKNEKRKSLVMLGAISVILLMLGVGLFIAGFNINDTVTLQTGLIMLFMGSVGTLLYNWGRKHPLKPASSGSRDDARQQGARQRSPSHR